MPTSIIEHDLLSRTTYPWGT